ncbi:zinc ribbon domain-containing protein [Natronomonas sp. EA1]|uniref:zinc ribbon domain-containing protein n=1 Tax=Natronomonas sp. EA1 TaxID=3421655 RepID=UPI003EB744B5
MTGIHAMGAYAPSKRVSGEAFAEAWGRFEGSGIESKAVPDGDEDALTMATEAGRRALEVGAFEAGEIEYLAFATTTPPLEEGDLAPRLASLLAVPETAAVRTHTGSTRAGMEALLAAIDADATGLVLVADAPSAEPGDAVEHAAGAGAAAFLVAPDAPVTVEARTEVNDPAPGTRFREAGSSRVEAIDAGTYDRGRFVNPVSEAVSAIDADHDAVALQAPDGKLPYRAGKVAGLDAEAIHEAAPVHDLGDLGAASVPVALARAFSQGAERPLAVAWGSGSALACALAGSAPVSLALDAGEEVTYAEYLRLRGDITDGEVSGGGAYVSVPTWKRSLPQRHRLEAGRCPECSALAFPPDGACPDCGGLVDFEPVRLPKTGTVEAVTTIGAGGAPPEFAPQQARSGSFPVAIVAFESDGGVSLPMQAVAPVEVGDTVTAIPRRIYTQEGVTRYGLKIRPLD